MQSKSKADFRIVYIAEAHPSDGWQVQKNKLDGILVKSHETLQDRRKAAEMLSRDLKIKIPIVVDGMDNVISKAYNAWPDRIFVVGKDGKVVYRGAPGPRGFDPVAAAEALETIMRN